ncbi:hypothetical protein KCP78_25420 [Salmonella enterica subsp. enterica]|nr:hypothetical protein KCP78_25420 [Salmonella enterica subsp. enterica]
MTSNVLLINKGDAMLGLKQVHHIAIIATDHAVSKALPYTRPIPPLAAHVVYRGANGAKRAVCD